MIDLYPHQIESLKQTEEQNRVAYYLDMGLGKTFVGSEKMYELGAKINLVVCQKSKVNDWVEHFKTYYPEYHTFDLTNKKQWEYVLHDCPYFLHEFVILVINYDLIFRRPEISKLMDFTLMLDESSLIQNENAKRSRFILKKLNPTNVILLSGTPTGGKYEKLWSQCRLLGWKISKDAFWSSYINYHFEHDTGFPRKVVDGYKNVERLKHKLHEHGAIFMKSEDVFDLPAKIDTRVNVYCTPAYRKFRQKSIVKIDGVEFVGDNILTKMLYERMLCGSYNSDKIAALKDLIESTEDRLIIFYNFNGELEVLRDLCASVERPVSIICGNIKDLSSYEKSKDSVTLVQYQAGAMGLNLQKSNKIVYFTPPLSSEFFEQSKKRIHRIGQDRTCFYYYLICSGSIEEKIYRTLAMRKDYTERLFENE